MPGTVVETHRTVNPTLTAYEALAPYYDRFTRGYEHGRWLAGLERWALTEGLQGRRLLDVACGTGKSFDPMLARGYAVTACDLSPKMVAAARKRGRDAAQVVVADMRALPWRQRFDLVTCINDAINYLLTPEDLAATLGGIARALVPGGVAIFDANSLLTYRTAFTARVIQDEAGSVFDWEGSASPDFLPGGLATATLTVIDADGAHSTRHVQRHWPANALQQACLSAGFERVVVRGQLPGAELVGRADELRHTKLVVLATVGQHGPERTLQAKHDGQPTHLGGQQLNASSP